MRARILFTWLLAASCAFAAIVGIACRTEPLSKSTGYSGEVEGYDSFDPLTYFDIWKGDLSWNGVLHLFDADLRRYVTREEWTRLVEKERRSGIRSLSTDEKTTLFQGALKAYFMSVRSTERSIVASEGTAEVVEEYAADPDGFYVVPKTREMRAVEVTSQWPDLLSQSDRPTTQRIFRSDEAEEDWSLDTEGTWTCQWIDGLVYSDFALPLVFSLPAMITVLDGNVLREGTYSGRRAILFQGEGNHALLAEWIDEGSLFPLGLILPKIASMDEPAGEGVLAREVQITAINPAQRIERPKGDCPSAKN